MQGGDFRNTVFGIGNGFAGEAYVANYDNDGIVCDTDGDGTDDEDDDDPLNPCVGFTEGNEDPTNPIWANADCDGDGVTNVNENTDMTSPYDPCSLVLASVSQNATDTGDCDGDGVTNADEINGLDDNFSTPGDNTDPNDPCDYNVGDQTTPDAAWNMADCDEDGNPNGGDPNPEVATAVDDMGDATPGIAETIDILGNDDFLDNLDPANLGTTAITQTGGDADGMVEFDENTGELIYTPTIEEAGMTVTVDYQVCNTTPDPDVCATATVTINVADGDDDGDGVPNSQEVIDMTDPDNPCSLILASVSQNATSMGDCDGDGVTNADEINGTDGDFSTPDDNTDPNDPCDLNLGDVSMNATSTGDCDGDGVTDADEINGLDDDFSTPDDNTDPNDPCDYNVADQITPDAAWDMADCDDDGNPNDDDPNPLVATAMDDMGNAMPEVAETIDILGNDDFLDNLDPANLGTTAITQTGGDAAGMVMFNEDTGELVYTPTIGESGMMVTVDYQVCNSDPDPDVCATATVTITVTDGDTDGDGVTNSQEVIDMTDPSNPCSLVLTSVSQNATSTGDCDGDGVTNADEINGTDGDFSTPGDNTDPNDPCDYNVADQGTPDAAWNMADCDEDGNPNGDDPNPEVATAMDDMGSATPEVAETIDILGNDDFLDNLDPANLGTTTITQTGGDADGMVVFDEDTGELIYTPTIEESGMMVTVEYQVCNMDPDPDVCATATVTITVADGDADGDGVPNSQEVTDMTDPTDACSLVLTSVSMNATSTGDCDGDGVTNADEINGTDGDFSTPDDNTDPNDPCDLNLGDVSMNATSTGDCDGDGVTNADEINGLDDDFSTPDDNTDPNDPCDYNIADQGTPDTAWGMADCDEDGNPNGNDPNPETVTVMDDMGNATPEVAETIDILGNDDFLDNLDPANLGVTDITQVGGNADGTVVFDEDTGELIYTPTIEESGLTVTVQYQVCNTTPDPDVCATATVTITVADGDSDGDGVPNSQEVIDMTDPSDACSLVLASVSQNATSTGDCDGDGVTDADEINGTDGDFSTPGDNTDPNDPCDLNLADVSQNATSTGDCDGDGVTDADEINGTDGDFSTPGDNTDPNDPCDFNLEDVSMNATSTGDCDGDGVTDADEINGTDGDFSTPGDNTDPNDPCSLNYLDATVVATDMGDCDGDGVTNADEVNGPDGDPNTPGDNSDPLNPCDPNSNSPACLAQLQVKVALQGALYDTGLSLMRDDLRAGNYLPTTEPYTALAGRFVHFGAGGGETTTTAVLDANAGTPDAIVDWVFVELRSAANSSTIVETRSALLQRDGDVVDPADGVSPLTFSGRVGDEYFVSVKHRNHLGAMTASPVTLTSTGTVVDFTTATAADLFNNSAEYDGLEQVTINGIQALWAGNTTADNKVKYQGPGTDAAIVLFDVLTHPDNSGPVFNFNSGFGYYQGDVNLDGKVKYQGVRNDVSYIFVNVLTYPINRDGGSVYNFDFMLEQLP